MTALCYALCPIHLAQFSVFYSRPPNIDRRRTCAQIFGKIINLDHDIRQLM